MCREGLRELARGCQKWAGHGRLVWGPLGLGSGQILRGHCLSHPSDPTPFTGLAHERLMRSSRAEGLLCQLSQLDQDAGGLGQRRRGVGKPLAGPQPLTTSPPTDPPDDNAVAARPQATLLDRHLLGGEKQVPSTGGGPFFYIGGSNGASL